MLMAVVSVGLLALSGLVLVVSSRRIQFSTIRTGRAGARATPRVRYQEGMTRQEDCA